MGLCESCMEEVESTEVMNQTPLVKDVEKSGDGNPTDSKEFYDSIIAEAEYAFLNASGRLPTSTGGSGALELKRKAETVKVKPRDAVQLSFIKPTMTGHPLERVSEVLSAPITINDHDILADEIVELVSQTLQLSKGDQVDTDIFSPLRSVPVN